MDGKTLALLYQTVQNDNILPVTTVCNVRCAFCSHHQNPPEVKAIAIPHLDPELVDDLLDYLDGSRKIIIGESTSLIMEGEPFTHPRFFEILEAIRRKFPQTLIQITTNGTMLNGTPLEPEQWQPLHTGDTIYAGSREYQITAQDNLEF